MITPVEMFACDCDNCGEKFVEEISGFAALNDKSAMQEMVQDSGWHVTNEGLCYCQTCHEFNDNDELVIKSAKCPESCSTICQDLKDCKNPEAIAKLPK